MTCFDCIFLANLAMYLVSIPRGELGQNPSILRVSPQHLERRGKPEPEKVRQRKMKEFGGRNYSLLE